MLVPDEHLRQVNRHPLRRVHGARYNIFGLAAAKFDEKIIRHLMVWHKPCLFHGECLGRQMLAGVSPQIVQG